MGLLDTSKDAHLKDDFKNMYKTTPCQFGDKSLGLQTILYMAAETD